MATFPNQKTIIIHKELVQENTERLYLKCYTDNIIKAMSILGSSAFKLYMFLLIQKNGAYWEFSPAYIMKAIGINSKTTISSIFNELIENKYLIPITENSNTYYNFYEGDKIPSSNGEKNIIELLNKHNIPFIFDKPYFCDLKGEYGYLRYDFILLNEDNQPYRLIEFDGPQHKQNTYNNEIIFQTTQEHDKIKNEYAIKHNLPLVRIPYEEKDNITLSLIFGDKYLIN